MAALAFIGVAATLSTISGGINAANTQKEICKQTDDTYKQIQEYCKAQSKLVSQLKCYDQELKNEIAKENVELADINANLQAVQNKFQSAYDNLELIIIFICSVVCLILVLKRLGFLEL